ncbi:hypothetical protein AB0H71_17145 [Nocardia sp. NPDC050697]|uniref:hypothetical protein n=1 Tax=Nocardia sp. NPDC050697 TaxID=3155158 RepID=UPI0033C594A6
MTRDLPFDDDETGERGGGDTAYRVANGVARTARAGAYVTGGALVAANGGGVPAQPGSEQHLDSWNAGWARSSDPDPDVPSPVLTFPDQGPATAAPHPVAHPGPSAPPAATEVTLPAPGLRFGTPPGGTDSMVAAVPPTPGWGGAATPGLEVGHAPGAGQIPLTPGWDSAAVSPTPGWSGHEFELPGTGTPLFQAPEMPSWWDGIGGKPEDDDQADGFGLPAHGLGQAGHGFGTGDITFTAPGADPLGLTRMSDADAVRTEDGHHGHHDSGTPGTGFGGGLFDGIGSDPFGVYFGVDAGAEIDTHFTVDFGLGPQGAYLYTDLRVEASAGVTVETAAGTGIGDQLDRFGEWLGSTPGAGRTGTESALPGASGSGLSSGLGGSGAGAPAGPGFVPPPAPVHAATAPAPQPAPVAPAAAVPIAVAPAVVAPPVVAATPLQTTIQPDAASTPIANVLAPPPGPSPLTAPAADLPLLFPAVVQPPPRPEPSTPPVTDHTAPHGDPAGPGTGLPTTVTRTTVQVPPVEPSTPATRPGAETGVTTKPAPTTLPDVTVTKIPPTADTRPSQGSTAPSADATTPGGAGSTAPTAPATRPEAPTRPSTADQPEPSRPATGGDPGTGRPTSGGDSGGSGTGTAPTVDVPTQAVPTPVKPPTADQPGTVPTVDNPSVPVPPNPATQPKPSAHGIADDGSGHWWQLPALTHHAPHTLAASEFGTTAAFGYGDPLHPLPDDHHGALL